jgi:hypothetical protein
MGMPNSDMGVSTNNRARGHKSAGAQKGDKRIARHVATNSLT